MARRLLTASVLTIVLLGTCFVSGQAVSPVAAAAGCVMFPETGHNLCGRFLAYWQEHGGLVQQGYPLTEALTEPSTIDGRVYTVQYFERAVFELHADTQPPYDIQLSQLGRDALQARYPNGTPAPGTSLPGACATFPETGHSLCGRFLTYWRDHGGLAQQGYPLTDVLTEQSTTDGRSYQVQYFERVVFELHADTQPPYDVLLGQLGRARLVDRYPTGPGGIDRAFISVGTFAIGTNSNTYVEWTLPVRNVSTRTLLAVTVIVTFYDASGQLLDQSLAGGANIAPGETRLLQGLSIKGLNYASYRVQPPQLTVRPAP